MADISAKQVNELRQRTGVGMMKCKDALVKTNGDMEAAVTLLREQGLAAADKKANRIAAEGAIAIATVGDVTAMVEVNAETDFVAKNEKFVTFANTIAEIAAKENPADLEALMAMEYPGFGGTVEDKRKDMILVIGENINVRRFARMEGACSSYIHDKGRIGVIVKFTEPASCGKFVAMQVASMSPKFVDDTEVDADWLEEEKKIAVQQLLNEGKPEAMLERIIPGKMKAILKEVCLVDQKFVKNGDLTVKQYVDEAAKELGKPIRVASMVRFEVGEGIEKKEENFAEEVAKQMGN